MGGTVEVECEQTGLGNRQVTGGLDRWTGTETGRRTGWGGKDRTREDKQDKNKNNRMSCSDSGSEDVPVGAQGDLASRTLVLESKRFYLDVKENQRGRFIKIAEISADGRKNQILMTFSTAALFSQNLILFIDFYHDLDKLDPDNLRQGELKSEVMYKDDKKYHMDLKENARGRFLKVSETFTRGYSRFQVFIPADGMAEFQHNLGELIDEYDNGEAKRGTRKLKVVKDDYDPAGDAEEALSAPQNKHLRIENKNFYFDIKRNQQGRYMSISEVKGNFRNSILVPESGWESFRDVLDDYVKQVKDGD